ncbi:MAG: hypothetical protein KF833_21420 [Verrucomicrobiae bacterium]|nr:hypothetical protein [Verrucomicrobiae bacterium]
MTEKKTILDEKVDEMLAIARDIVLPGLDAEQCIQRGLEMCGGAVDRELLAQIYRVGCDGDPENAARILLSMSANARDWLDIPAPQRIPIMSKPIPVLRYGASEIEEHDLVPWRDLTVPQFRRAVDVKRRCLVPLDTQLARMGRRRKARGPKWEMLEKGLGFPRKCELSNKEVAEIICEMARLGKFSEKRAVAMIRELRAS